MTPARAEAGHGQRSIELALADLITYSRNGNHTRLNLKGGIILEVKETADQIDRLARAASAQT